MLNAYKDAATTTIALCFLNPIINIGTATTAIYERLKRPNWKDGNWFLFPDWYSRYLLDFYISNGIHITLRDPNL
jgi:tryptophan-rich sensory protein